MAYTNINDPSAYFQSLRWTGNGTSTRDFTFDGNSDLQPDACMWFRENGQSPRLLTDSSRSWESGNYELTWNSNIKEGDTNAINTGQYGWLAGHSSLTNGLRGYVSSSYTNSTGGKFYAASWKVNGGTTSSNTDGSITSTVQNNSDSGISIITYTGTGSNGTIGHGLGVTPKFLFFKDRTSTGHWATWHEAIGDDYKLTINSYGIKDADGAFMNSTLPTSSVITKGGASVHTNASSKNYVCYAFTDVQGYSKYGSYKGNGNANGTFIYTGFKPRAIFTKKVTGPVGSWVWHDSRMGQSTGSGTSSGTDINPATANQVIESNSNLMDDYGDIDFLSNGFKIRDTDGRVNENNTTYIYMAWADSPFTTSTGTPTTAR